MRIQGAEGLASSASERRLDLSGSFYQEKAIAGHAVVMRTCKRFLPCIKTSGDPHCSKCRAPQSPGGLSPAGGLHHQDMAKQLLHKRAGTPGNLTLPVHEPRDEVKVKDFNLVQGTMRYVVPQSRCWHLYWQVCQPSMLEQGVYTSSEHMQGTCLRLHFHI